MKKIALALALVGISSSIHAGTLELVNTSWEYIAIVEVKRGLNGSPVETYTGVYKDRVITTAEDKIWYRRSRIPGDANSGFGRWHSVTHLNSGKETVEIK